MKELVTAIKNTGRRDLFVALYPWVVNLAAGLLISWGGARWFMSKAGEQVFHQGRFRYFITTLFHDLGTNSPGSMTALIVIGILIVIGLLILSLFISAGIYGVLIHDDPVTVKSLFLRSTRHFGRFFRISLAGILPWIAAAVVPGVIFYLHYRAQTRSLDETLLWIFIAVWAPITILFLIAGSATVDFARIIGLQSDHNVFKTLWFGFKKLLSRWGAVLLLFLGYLALTVLLFFIQFLLEKVMGGIFILVFILYQAAIFGRYFFKAVLMRSEVALAGE